MTAKKDIDAGAPQKLSDVVYDQLLQTIAEGGYRPDTKLPTENELAERLGVSRPTVREALARLRDDGVVSSKRGSGTYVVRVPSTTVLHFAPLSSIADMQRCFEFRIGLEGEAAYWAAQPHRLADTKQLQEALSRLEATAGSALGVEEDFAFHLAVAKLTDNRFFEVTMLSLRESILTGISLTRSLSLQRPRTRLNAVLGEHVDIYDAIAAREPEKARAAMRRHLENAKRRVFEGVD